MLWRFRSLKLDFFSSWLWYRVLWEVDTTVSDKHSASIFRIPWNVVNHVWLRRADWLKWWCWLLFVRCPVRISVVTPTISRILHFEDGYSSGSWICWCFRLTLCAKCTLHSYCWLFLRQKPSKLSISLCCKHFQNKWHLAVAARDNSHAGLSKQHFEGVSVDVGVMFQCATFVLRVVFKA